MAIHYFTEGIDYPLPTAAVTGWLERVLAKENARAKEINYIFCSDDYLLAMNRQYLNHDTYTDILTFDNADEPGKLEADIYISLDRVKENAATLNINVNDELQRVMVHGLLHLLGYTDKTEEEKKEMREKEDACLSLR